jgi:hypothetical protein
MRKTEITGRLRQHVKDSLSPTLGERDMVSRVYESVRAVLGRDCLLVGSYARFTACRPLHDLDVLFIAGRFDANNLNPSAILSRVQQALQQNFRNPTRYRIQVSQQSHSITISFLENKEEQFAVDIVPAFTSGLKNEFGDDVYWVPEISTVSRRNRRSQYEAISRAKKTESEWWIKSDPRGYISAATILNDKNNDFRKAAKVVKRWKHNCAAQDENFTVKSFHIEQALVGIFGENPRFDLFDAIFTFFCRIPQIISRPQIRDRADRAKFIDEYLNDLTEPQRRQIIKARDAFLIKLEDFSQQSAVTNLLQAASHPRASATEQYLFDSEIPVLTEWDAQLRVTGTLLPRDGFRAGVLDAAGVIQIDRRITFTANLRGPYSADLLKWKVKNDNRSPQPRGEITNHRTLNNPERTLYNGAHYVECFAIKDGICIARGRQNVVLK